MFVRVLLKRSNDMEEISHKIPWINTYTTFYFGKSGCSRGLTKSGATLK